MVIKFSVWCNSLFCRQPIKNIHLRCHFGLSKAFKNGKIRSCVVCYSLHAVIICVFDIWCNFVCRNTVKVSYSKAPNMGLCPEPHWGAFRAGYACSGNSQLVPNGLYREFLDYTLILYLALFFVCLRFRFYFSLSWGLFFCLVLILVWVLHSSVLPEFFIAKHWNKANFQGERTNSRLKNNKLHVEKEFFRSFSTFLVICLIRCWKLLNSTCSETINY